MREALGAGEHVERVAVPGGLSASASGTACVATLMLIPRRAQMRLTSVWTAEGIRTGACMGVRDSAGIAGGG